MVTAQECRHLRWAAAYFFHGSDQKNFFFKISIWNDSTIIMKYLSWLVDPLPLGIPSL